MISHTVDKLNRLEILDKEEYKKEIKKLQKDIEEEEKVFINEN